MRIRRREPAAEPVEVKPDVDLPGAPSVRINAFRIGLVGGLGVLVSLLIGGIVTQLGTVLVYVGIALFLALGLDPLVSLLEKKMPRPLAITIVFAGVLGVFAALVFALVPLIATEGTHFVKNFPELAQSFANSDWVRNVQAQLAGFVDIEAAVKSATEFIQNPSNIIAIGGGILAVGAGVAAGVTGAIIVLILTLYFLASLRSMKRLAYRFVPASRRPGFAQITEEITTAVGRYVVGQGSLALINGVLSLIFLTIIGAPLPVLLAFIAFLASLVPLVGTLTGAIVITTISLLASPLTALVSAIYYLIYMQVEAYLLSPRIMNRAVSVPGSMVVIAAVGGGAIGGVLGALVAIPVAASAIIILEKVVLPRQDEK